MDVDVVTISDDEEVPNPNGPCDSSSDNVACAGYDEPSTETPEELEAEADRYKGMGNALFNERKYTEAIKCYTNAIEKAPQSPSAVLCLGNRSACYINLKMYDKALDDLEKARQLDNSYNKYYPRVIKCKCMKGDFKGVEDTINKIPAAAMDDSVLMEINSFNLLQNQYQLCLSDYNQKKFREAAYQLRLLMEKMDNGVSSPDIRALQGECYAKSGAYEKGHDIANSVLATNQMHVEAIYVRGYCLYYENEIDKALGEFQVVLKLDPDHTKAKEIYKMAKSLKAKKDQGYAAFRSNKFEDAHNIYTDCLSIDPNNKLLNAQLHCNRAVTLKKLKRYEQALPDFKKALELDPKYYMVYKRRGQCYEEMMKYEELVADYEKLYSLVKTQENLVLLQKAKIELKKSKRVNYYTVLGVSANASPEEISKAYKSKAKAHHPDRHSSKSSEEKREQEKIFKQIGEAYGILSDPKKRDQYDRGDGIDDGVSSSGFHHGGFPFSSPFSQSSFGEGYTYYFH